MQKGFILSLLLQTIDSQAVPGILKALLKRILLVSSSQPLCWWADV